MLQISVLGDLMVASGNRTVEIHQQKLRTLVCSLVVDAGEFVPVEVLEDRLWGDDRPATARKSIQTYVSKLRAAWGADGARAISTSGSRYRLSTTEADLDARRFEAAADAGGRALERGMFEDAAALFSEALSIWRGRALADVLGADWAQPEANRLEEERLNAWERRIEADMRLGRHVDVVPELTELVLLHPLRETLCAHLMVALYRSRRQAEALSAFRWLREQLVEQLGIDPSLHLCHLEQGILSHEPEMLEPSGDLMRTFG